MTTLYKIEDLRPLYAELITNNEEHVAKLRAKLDADLYSALEWHGPALTEYAVERRWLTGLLEVCERMAAENAGMVDRTQIDELIRNRVLEMARGDYWSSNPVSMLMRKAELALLAKTMEVFGNDLNKPFRTLDFRNERAEYQAKMEAAMWRIKMGKRYISAKPDTLYTNKPENAAVWSYRDRPTLQPGQSYEMVE